jgi:hypothetical protein
MAAKKQVFIEVELDWAEQQLTTWKAYIDKHPFEDMDDRVKWKETKSGGAMPVVVATIEQQQKSIRDTMKDYLMLLKEVKVMRAAEEAIKKEVRGGGDVPPRMQ